mgnify:CR=1 FL=1
MIRTINISYPIKETDQGGVFKGTTTTEQAIRSDLFALLTLREGQRPMQSRMFSPIYRFLFEPMDEISKDQLTTQIKDKVKEFIPQIEVNKIIYNDIPERNLLNIRLNYTIIDFFNVEQILILNFPVEFQN